MHESCSDVSSSIPLEISRECLTFQCCAVVEVVVIVIAQMYPRIVLLGYRGLIGAQAPAISWYSVGERSQYC